MDTDGKRKEVTLTSPITAVGTKLVSVDSLVWDKDLYPRVDISEHNVRLLADKIRAGIDLEPIVIESRTNRITDGVHRWHGYKREKVEKVKANIFRYKSTPTMLQHSIQLNSCHGTNLTSQDIVRAIGLLQAAGFDDAASASTLSISLERLEDLKTRLAWETSDPQTRHEATSKSPKSYVATHDLKPVPLKYGTRQLSGKQLTKEQVDANDKYTGHEQIFSVNNVIRLIEGRILDTENAKLMARLRHLGELIARL